MTRINHLVLIGVGLIGGSFALDLKRQHLVGSVTGIDTDRSNLSRALERRVIDCAFETVSGQAVQAADLVLIATPVAVLPEICAALAPVLPPDAVVSDVGSTKQSALAAFAAHLPHHLARCVAAHPIAGSDRSGSAAARYGLYRDKKLIVCPHPQQDSGSLNTVAALWQAVGAQVHAMSAAEHDEIFAAVSHFPHLLAFAYIHQMLDHPQGADYLNFAGSGFRDFTRIAASSAPMWTGIMLENRHSLLQLIADQQRQLDRIARSLQQNDADSLHRYIQAAAALRRQWEQQHG